MVRNSEKKLGSTVSKYKTFVKMVEKALDPQNPTMERSLAQNRANVQEGWIHDFFVVVGGGHLKKLEKS